VNNQSALRPVRAPRPAGSKLRHSQIEICILTGGKSTRMGRDKARLRLRGRTMLSIVRAVARGTNLRVRVIRRDIRPRCGPLGGILTGLRSTRAEGVLFLACDMPLITVELLRKIIRARGDDSRAVFSSQSDCTGFPLLLPVEAAHVVQAQINSGHLSIRQLATFLRARRLAVSARTNWLFNVNTPEDIRTVARLLAPSSSDVVRTNPRRG